MKVYHGSPDTFDKINLDKGDSIGFHAGTLEQAMFILNEKYPLEVPS